MALRPHSLDHNGRWGSTRTGGAHGTTGFVTVPCNAPKIRVRDKEGRAQVGHVSRSTPTGAAQPL